jgi:hypothetical protein
MNQQGTGVPACTPWGPMRVVYLQYASDAVTFFDESWFFREPDWLQKPRGPDVSPEMRWYPVVTMVQTAVDMPLSMSTPIGFGHAYARGIPRGLGRVVGSGEWSGEIARLQHLAKAAGQNRIRSSGRLNHKQGTKMDEHALNAGRSWWLATSAATILEGFGTHRIGCRCACARRRHRTGAHHHRHPRQGRLYHRQLQRHHRIARVFGPARGVIGNLDDKQFADVLKRQEVIPPAHRGARRDGPHGYRARDAVEKHFARWTCW